MKEAKFTFSPILFIGLLILGGFICYYTGSFVVNDFVDTSNLSWIFKGLTVFLGGLIWVGFCFLILILMTLYFNLKEFLK